MNATDEAASVREWIDAERYELSKPCRSPHIASTLADALDLAARLEAALAALLRRYVSLASSGDCGHWNPEDEPEVIAARSALAAPSPATSTDHPRP